MNAWGALTIVLCVLTVVAGLVGLGTLAILCILQARRDKYEYMAWVQTTHRPHSQQVINVPCTANVPIRKREGCLPSAPSDAPGCSVPCAVGGVTASTLRP